MTYHLWPCDPIFLMRESDQGWVGKVRQDRLVSAGCQTTRGGVERVVRMAILRQDDSSGATRLR
jgi:hypothetical protein